MFAGIDVSHRRGCAWAVLDSAYNSVAAGWVDSHQDDERTAETLISELKTRAPTAEIIVGVDGPRMPMSRPCMFRWVDDRWKRSAVPLKGRHCELILSTLRIATPQWTPAEQEAPRWMRLGFALFARLGKEYRTVEVFPSATYRLMQYSDALRMNIDLRSFARGPSDILDAYVGALTAGEFIAGRGCEVVR